MLETVRMKGRNVQIEESYDITSAPFSQHAWNSEKEKQERIEEPYGLLVSVFESVRRKSRNVQIFGS